MDGLGFINLLEDVMLRGNEEEVQLFAGIWRMLWLRRNTMIHEGRFTHPDVLVQMAKTEVAELNMVMDENKHEPGTPEREIVHVWSNYINRKKIEGI
jgi:hypothetical protein